MVKTAICLAVRTPFRGGFFVRFTVRQKAPGFVPCSFFGENISGLFWPDLESINADGVSHKRGRTINADGGMGLINADGGLKRGRGVGIQARTELEQAGNRPKIGVVQCEKHVNVRNYGTR